MLRLLLKLASKKRPDIPKTINILKTYKINDHVKISYTVYGPNYNKILIHVYVDDVQLNWPLDLNIHRLERNQWYRTATYDVYLSMFFTYPKKIITQGIIENEALIAGPTEYFNQVLLGQRRKESEKSKIESQPDYSFGTLWIDNFSFNNHACSVPFSFTKRCILVWDLNGKVLNTSKYICA